MTSVLGRSNFCQFGGHDASISRIGLRLVRVSIRDNGKARNGRCVRRVQDTCKQIVILLCLFYVNGQGSAAILDNCQPH